MSIFEQLNTPSYDYGLGIEPGIVDYIKESHIVQIRISPTPCYLLRQELSGSVVASAASPIIISSYIETGSQYKAQIWPSGSYEHPDIRPDTNQGSGSVRVSIDGQVGVRVFDSVDLIDNSEFAIVKRWDLDPARVELVLNSGYIPGSSSVTYYYSAMDQDTSPERMKSYETASGSFFGWNQYLSSYTDNYVGANQLLVRMPLVVENIVINEEGNVVLKENQCWTLWDPYIRNFDLLVVPSTDSPVNEELRFQVIDKQDSKIQGQLVSQRFRVKLLERTSKIYDIPYLIV